MDPVSAIGLASSILTFVEFAVNLFAGSVKIYRSADGALDENKQLDRTINELDSLCALLDRRPTCRTEAGRKISRIARDCRTDSKKLEGIIKHIANTQNKRHLWKSVRASWMSIRSRKDVAEMKNRLQGYRSEVLLEVTLLLREEQSSLGLGIAKIRDDCSQLKIGFRTDITSTRSEILDAISSLNKPDHGGDFIKMSLADISNLLLSMQTKIHETQLQHRILRQLVFKEMNSRANQIDKAAQDTYTWMLQDGPINKWDGRSHVWKMFLEWLRTGENILLVSGNPGSGKSTLMKFLTEHERTKEELAVWQPELMENVFALHLRRMRAFSGNTTVEEIQSFDEDQIEEAFGLLLDRASQGGYRLCLFIDGLDECEGKRIKHEELALQLQRWTVPGTIKLCVSSRPYSEFVGTLSTPGNQTIQLHKLNESDIRAYCMNRFENDIHARERSKLCQVLAETVVKQAQGVFLWVHLVIDILFIGLRQANSDSVLLEQLNSLPSDLDLLYTRLREPIEADRIQRDISNRMLLLAVHNPSRANLTALAFSWLEEQGCEQGGLMNPSFPSSSDPKPYCNEEISDRVDIVTKQINGLARGFLELTESHSWPIPKSLRIGPFFIDEVQFCHRTAREYLLHNEDRRRSLLESFPNFEPSSVYKNLSRRDDLCPPCNIDPDLVGRFELPVRGLRVPILRFLPSSSIPEANLEDPDYPFDQISFLEYAAFCGLSRFVLREVAKDSTKLDGISSCGNVLLAAVIGYHYDLASELLSLSRGKTQLCEVGDEHGNTQSLVPACVLAIARVLECIMGVATRGDQLFDEKCYFSNRDLNFGTDLLRFSISLKMALQITVVGAEKLHTEWGIHGPNKLYVQIDAADAVKLLDSLKTPENPAVPFRAYSGNWLLKKMGIERLGRVVDKGTEATHRMQEWPDESHHFLSGDPEKKEGFVGNIEWAFEDQELKELKGYFRVY